MRPRTLKEITRTQFWKLEDMLKDGRLKPEGGEVQISYRGDNKTYYNSQGNWLMSVDGVYFAHHSIANR